MQKILPIFMAGLAITTSFKLDLQRTSFQIHSLSRPNGYLRGPKGLVRGSQDVNVKWIRKVAKWRVHELLPGFELDYQGKFPKEFAGFGPCESYPDTWLIEFAQQFFNRVLTNYNRARQCPIPEGSVRSPGRLQWTRKGTNGIHCDVPVKVTLWLKEHWEELSWAGQRIPNEAEFFRAVYEGKFTNC